MCQASPHYGTRELARRKPDRYLLGAGHKTKLVGLLMDPLVPKAIY